jgi:predicted O-methyltransferase YrrM
VDPQTWTAVDRHLTELLVPPDAALSAALDEASAAGLPAHHVSPTEGAFLYLLTRMCGARRVLEIGTLAGYSTIWLARALPAGGVVVTLESNERHAEVAIRNFARAGVADRVELRVGPASETLAGLRDRSPFDLVFIDADKPNNPAYLDWALELSRPGTVIVGDNVVRGGAVADADDNDASVVGVRRFLQQLADDPRVTATALQTVGAKGYDGFALALVR